ncbi:hypothetical protein BJX99DRAFT_226480 [Aspergillus californicus]
MTQTGQLKACWGGVEAYHTFQWRASSAEWWQTVDITLQAAQNTSAPTHTWPTTHEAVELWVSASASSESESTAWTRFEHGPGSALLHRALQAAPTPAQWQQTSAIRFVFAAKPGSLARSDILSLRLVDLESVDAVVSFFAGQPEKSLSPFPVDAHAIPDVQTVLHAVLNSAAGGLLVRPPVEYTESNNYRDVFQALDEELANRLSFPWVLDTPAPRKTLAIVAGGRSSPEHGGSATSIYTAAQALNIDMVVLDVEGHWLQGPKYAHWRKGFLPVELEPPSLLRDRVLQALAGRKVDGIVTFCDSYQVAVAEAADRLGLPTAPAEAYGIATDKYRTGVSEGRPAYLVNSLDGALEVVQRGDLDYPFIVKPCKGFLSEGVFKIDGVEGLSRAFQGVNEDRHGTEVVLEQYCDGPEVDINFVLSEGEILFCEISDDFPKTADVSSTGSSSHAPTSFIELGNVLPSKLPCAEIDLLHTSLHQSLTRLGLTTGIYHLEARVQNSSMEYGSVRNPHTTSEVIDLIPRSTRPTKDPYAWLIEINPRPPGIQETAAVQSVYGVDYWGLGLLSSVRDHERLRALSHPFTQGPQYFCEMVFIPVESGGRFESDDVCADLASRRPDLARHISKSFCFLKRGDVVRAPESGITAWVAYYVVFSRVSREHLLGVTAEVRRETRFTVV